MFKWLRRSQAANEITAKKIIALHYRLRLILKSYTPIAGTDTRNFNFEYVCRECGGYLMDIADKTDDLSLVTCTACGEHFGSLLLVKTLATEIGLIELEKRGLGKPSISLPVVDPLPDRTPENDLIVGWQLCITMQRRTPLAWLLKHGEFLPGALQPHEELPMQHAIWVPTTYSFRYKGIDLDEAPAGDMASEIGYIPSSGGEFLVFLIEYRKIFEAELSGQYKLDAFRALGDIFPQYRKLCF